MAPATISEVSYEDLIEALLKQYKKQKNKYSARLEFNRRNRKKHETFNDFYSVLKRLSVDCEFGVNLDERLIESIICGISNDEVTRRLISEEDLKLDKCQKVMKSYES